MTCLLPHRFDPLHLPLSAVQMSSTDRAGFQHDPIPLKHVGQNQKILPVFLMLSELINHQLGRNSSKQPGDKGTSAAAIWDTIVSLYDTLNVSSNNLVHIRVSDESNGESLLFLDVWPSPAFYK